jgi:TM2 domain-containing membrane protein YozV
MYRGNPSSTSPIGPIQQRSVGVAYLLWLLGFFGINGVHRFYVNKPISGSLWLVTFGWFYIGQFIDLFLIPGMVEDYNLRQQGLYAQALAAKGLLSTPPLRGENLMRRIMQLAAERQGVLTVSEAIAAIEANFDDIETAFRELERRGYADSENHWETGVVQYRFLQLENH